jgi:hypothetical protein
MGKAFFKPWIGRNYGDTRVLVLSESAYSWRDDSGKINDPAPTHPTNSLLHWTNPDRFGEQKYFTAVSRALCGAKTPTSEGLAQAWSECAYTIFVQRTVGLGSRSRPSPSQWKEAPEHFLRLIEEIRPLKVIVTGLGMWKDHMPHTFDQRGDDLQAYRLSDGALVWCLALPHPSNSRVGFKWEEIGERIRHFKKTKLPLRK